MHIERPRMVVPRSMVGPPWAYTLDDGDDDSNTVPSKVTADNLKKYDISPQGQADEICAVAEAVNNIGDNDGDGENDGLGVFYWGARMDARGHRR